MSISSKFDQAAIDIVLRCTDATDIVHCETVQTLWSGYGQILRLKLAGADIESVIVKLVRPPTHDARSHHPRGWNTDHSDRRKRASYQVEANWYQNFAGTPSANCRTAAVYAIQSNQDQHTFVIEDLNAVGYSRRIVDATLPNVQLGLRWLANFHATHLHRVPAGLWPRGTYWHLDTRPDELAAMPTDDPLRIHAAAIDQQLANCSYQTIVHGDAKLANFCFSRDADKIAAVDFQYVGGGCGMSDVAYFIGSCLIDDQSAIHENDLLKIYFSEFETAVDPDLHPDFEFAKLRKSWTDLFPTAWADFNRFLIGWSPGHRKLTPYSRRMTDRALATR